MVFHPDSILVGICRVGIINKIVAHKGRCNRFTAAILYSELSSAIEALDSQLAVKIHAACPQNILRGIGEQRIIKIVQFYRVTSSFVNKGQHLVEAGQLVSQEDAWVFLCHDGVSAVHLMF